MTRPLQVYTHCPRPRPLTRPLADSSSMPPSSLALVPQPPDDLPIVIRKDTRFTCNPHLVYNFLSYHCLSLPYFAFVSTLSFVSIPTSTRDVLFIFLLLSKTSSQPKQLSVSSWVILNFKGVIDVILPTQIGTSSLLMSVSLRVLLSSPLKSILMFRMSYMSLFSYHLQISLLHLRML